MDTKLGLPAGVGRGDLEKAMQDHVLAVGKLMGPYSRKQRY